MLSPEYLLAPGQAGGLARPQFPLWGGGGDSPHPKGCWRQPHQALWGCRTSLLSLPQSTQTVSHPCNNDVRWGSREQLTTFLLPPVSQSVLPKLFHIIMWTAHHNTRWAQ